MQLTAQTSIKSAKINFTIQNAGLEVEGSFSGLNGTLVFDPENFRAGSVSLLVPVSSIKTGIALRDSHLKKPEYFDEKKWPTIQLNSKFFGKSAEGFKGYFTLTIKGVTKDVTIPFTVEENDGIQKFSAIFEVNRLDYGVGSKSLVMGNTVKVKVIIEVNNKSKE